MWQVASRALAILEGAIAIAFLIGSTGVLFLNVVLRYFFQAGFSWAEEFITFSMIWITFIGASICVRLNAHVAMRLVVESVKTPSVRRLYEVALLMASAGFCGIALILGVRQVLFLATTGQLSPAMQVPMAWVYLAIPVGFGLMLVRMLEQLARTISQVPSNRAADT